MNDWANYMNKAYIRLYAPKVKFFKLDKANTVIDELYGEESSTRIYLSPIEMNSFYFNNSWTSIVGERLYEEQESKEMKFTLNFEDMVQTILAAKKRKIATIRLSYADSSIMTAYKLNNILVIKKGGSTIVNYDLTNSTYSTIAKLYTALSSVNASLSVTKEGTNGLSTDLVDFEETDFSNSTLEIYVPDNTFSSSSDVFEMGDIILTSKWRLYQIDSAYPGGEFGWDYATYIMNCSLANMDQVSLPGNYKEQIIKNMYGIQKVEME